MFNLYIFRLIVFDVFIVSRHAENIFMCAQKMMHFAVCAQRDFFGLQEELCSITDKGNSATYRNLNLINKESTKRGITF